LDKREYKILCEIFKAKEQSLRRALEGILRKAYPADRVYATPQYLYALGDIPVALVAHLDTVHPFAPYEIFRDSEKGVIWSPEGIGADDRAGVYSIHKLLRQGLRPSVIFCTGEEKGGIGASAFVLNFPAPLVPTNFIIELDRCGSNDMVFYDCDNPEFESFIGTYGFELQYGSFSDISIIAPVWGIAAVNLSIGYEDEHTYSERLYYREMEKTIKKVENILSTPSLPAFEYIPYIFMPRNTFKFDPKTCTAIYQCDGCDGWYPADSLTTVPDGDYQWRFCPTCLNHFTSTCQKCGETFIHWGDIDRKCCLKCLPQKEEDWPTDD